VGAVDAAIARLIVTVVSEGGDDAEVIDAQARLLRDELLESDVQDAVLLVEGSPPAGARAIDAVTVGQVVVTVVSTMQALVSLSQALVAWLGRRSGKRLVLEFDGARLEVTGASLVEQRRLVEAFLAGHAEPAPDPGPNQP
jgi:hypothetical protein